jgi:hypothetical protein
MHCIESNYIYGWLSFADCRLTIMSDLLINMNKYYRCLIVGGMCKM